MSVNRILALSSSRVGSGSYLQNAALVIQGFLGQKTCTIAFIPFASVDENYEAYTEMVRGGLINLPHTIVTVTPAGISRICFPTLLIYLPDFK